VRASRPGFPGGKAFENVSDGRGLVFIDPAFAALGFARCAEFHDHVVAVGVAAAGPAGLDAAAQAAPRLVGKVLQIQRPHRALEADVELADRAFRERQNLHAGKAQALIDPGDVFLIAGYAVE
jgi:hypothetical protein